MGALREISPPVPLDFPGFYARRELIDFSVNRHVQNRDLGEFLDSFEFFVQGLESRMVSKMGSYPVLRTLGLTPTESQFLRADIIGKNIIEPVSTLSSNGNHRSFDRVRLRAFAALVWGYKELYPDKPVYGMPYVSWPDVIEKTKNALGAHEAVGIINDPQDPKEIRSRNKKWKKIKTDLNGSMTSHTQFVVFDPVVDNGRSLTIKEAGKRLGGTSLVNLAAREVSNTENAYKFSNSRMKPYMRIIDEQIIPEVDRWPLDVRHFPTDKLASILDIPRGHVQKVIEAVVLGEMLVAEPNLKTGQIEMDKNIFRVLAAACYVYRVFRRQQRKDNWPNLAGQTQVWLSPDHLGSLIHEPLVVVGKRA